MLLWAPTSLWWEIVSFCIICVSWQWGERERERSLPLCWFLHTLFYCGGSCGGVVLNIIKPPLCQSTSFLTLPFQFSPTSHGVGSEKEAVLLCCLLGLSHKTIPGLCSLLVPCFSPSRALLLLSATASAMHAITGETLEPPAAPAFPPSCSSRCAWAGHTLSTFSALRLQAC